jgi:hypothetical protein
MYDVMIKRGLLISQGFGIGVGDGIPNIDFIVAILLDTSLLTILRM